MPRLSMIPLALIGAILSGSGSLSAPTPAANGPATGRTLILFGASWCAPCLIELRELPRLAAAAEPDRLTVAWIDGRAERHLPRWPSDVRLIEGVEARGMLDRMGSDAAGLPYAVLLDEEGRRCAEWRAPLAPADIARMRLACR